MVLDVGLGVKVLPINLTAVDQEDPASLAGKRVIIVGLMQRAELNGKFGTLGVYDYEEGRYQVKVDRESDGAATASERADCALTDDLVQVAIKPTNLKLLITQASDSINQTDAVAAGLALRARLRWRMALMGVRLTRVLEMQKSDEYRLCDARVDDPRNEGFGTGRHTTYRVTTQVSGIAPPSMLNMTIPSLQSVASIMGDQLQCILCQQIRQGNHGWMTCRRRFAEFQKLRRALLLFLPGVGDRLPQLPEKKAISLTAAVIAERRHGLEEFLQGVLDHPTLSTSDEVRA